MHNNFYDIVLVTDNRLLVNKRCVDYLWSDGGVQSWVCLQVMAQEIDGEGKGEADERHHQRETDEIAQSSWQCCSDDSDGFVITRSVEEYPLTVLLRRQRWFCGSGECGGAAAERWMPRFQSEPSTPRCSRRPDQNSTVLLQWHVQLSWTTKDVCKRSNVCTNNER